MASSHGGSQGGVIVAALGYWAQALLDGGEDGAPKAPPGSPPTQKFIGPWFSTQLTLSLAIGVTSFLAFCFLRTRWDIVYMGRTKLKDFSPTPAHSPDALSGRTFLGWIMPTLRTSEFTVLQTVGLDAAVLLSFFRMGFLLFSLAAALAAVVLMPLNFFRHGSTDAEPDDPNGPDNSTITGIFQPALPLNATVPAPSITDLILDPHTSTTINLIFTYLFTFLVLSFLHRNFHRFVRSRQAFALHLIHSISARTVLVTNVPSHLRGDRALADYFEGCGWTVESVSVCREIEPLRRVLQKRTDALLKLEEAWTDWVGNPAAASVQGYDPNIYDPKRSNPTSLTASPRGFGTLIPDLDDQPESQDRSDSGPSRTASGTTDTNAGWGAGDEEAGQGESASHVHTTRPRPTYRPRWFGNKVDAIEYWEGKYRVADEQVRESRKKGIFKASHTAFVTFEDVKDAQAACQVVHYPHHSKVVTEPAPEPRDIIWSQMSMSARERSIRGFIVMGLMGLLLVTWIAPVTSLASLLSYNEIKKVAPWLARLIDASPRLAAIVQNSLPSVAIITFNGLLPFLLSWMCYQQGFKSRSSSEYSLMRKYYLFLLVSVLFIFLLTTTIWAIFRDLADTPMKIPEKLAAGLQGANSRNFMVSYVMLQGLGLMPLQLINLGPLLSLGWARALYTKTPRDHAEANAPPMLNYGWVYPQSLLVFTVTLVYSVVSPLILIFGAIYFGVAYLVYKYKLLYIYYKPYESNGEAWRITFDRLLWALVIFQLFMTGIFTLSAPKSPILPAMMVPLIMYTLWWSYRMFNDFGPLSKYLALSSICEVQRGEGADAAAGVRGENGVPRQQSNLNHRRYAVNDETLYVAPSDKRTDYSQPPMSSFYYGVLNTGRRRYAHPALTGSLPQPWLPAKDKPQSFGDGAAERRGVVLSLRRKMAKRLKRQQSGDGSGPTDGEAGDDAPEGWSVGNSMNVEAGDEQRGAVSRSPSRDRRDQPVSGSAGGSGSFWGSSNPWSDPVAASSRGFDENQGESPKQGNRRQVSFDPISGTMALPEENVWGNDDDDDDDEEDERAPHGAGSEEAVESPSTYFHHPERRSQTSAPRLGTNMGLNGQAPAPPESRIPL